MCKNLKRITMRNLLSYIFLIAIFSFNIYSQPNVALSRFTSKAIFRNAGLSVQFSDAETNKVIASFSPNLNLTPASTVKLITTATALEMFGPDFQFQTEVTYSGKIVDGFLDGDLYIIGHGDPTIGSMFSLQSNALFDSIVSELHKHGIHQILGRIVGDESAYNTELIPSKTPWEDMGNYYAAGVGALNYGDNSYKLTFRTGAAGTVPQILSVQPSIQNLSFQNYLIAKTNDKDSAYLRGMPYQFERYIYGTVPANRESFSIKGDVPDPAFFFVSELNSYLEKNGIKVKNQPLTSRILSGDMSGRYGESMPKMDSNLTKLCSFRSDKLSHIIQITNKRSYNLYAEALLRLIASKVSKDASLPAGIAAVKQFWAERKLDVGFLMYDGSGLSPADRVNASFFVQLLHFMSTKSKNSEVYFSSLAVAGVDGTLKSFLESSPLKGKVKAKSGSFDGVLSYCGVLNKNGKKYHFCIIVNAFTCPVSAVKKSIEQLLTEF